MYLIQYNHAIFGFKATIGTENDVYNLCLCATYNPQIYTNMAVYRLIPGKNPEHMNCIYMAKFDRVYIYDNHKNYIGCYEGSSHAEN